MDRYRLKALPIPEEEVFWRESRETVFNIMNYPTESMEKRTITTLKMADPYSINDFPRFSAKLIYYCGLFAGETDLALMRHLSCRAPLAVDAQGLLRKVFPDGGVRYVRWDEKAETLPLCRFFKADAAEAAFLTGIDTEEHEGRVRAAEAFLDQGAKEVVISHHSELVAADVSGVVAAPLRNRTLSGRTGRGDTCLASYVTERFNKEPAESIRLAAAVTSMKLEDPGPFKKSRSEVEAFMREFYGAAS
ncbi:MAG: PfkB family carbohydrate kinase [Thermodesulfobacteriota bacterium]